MMGPTRHVLVLLATVLSIAVISGCGVAEGITAGMKLTNSLIQETGTIGRTIFGSRKEAFDNDMAKGVPRDQLEDAIDAARIWAFEEVQTIPKVRDASYKLILVLAKPEGSLAAVGIADQDLVDYAKNVFNKLSGSALSKRLTFIDATSVDSIEQATAGVTSSVDGDDPLSAGTSDSGYDKDDTLVFTMRFSATADMHKKNQGKIAFTVTPGYKWAKDMRNLKAQTITRYLNWKYDLIQGGGVFFEPDSAG